MAQADFFWSVRLRLRPRRPGRGCARGSCWESWEGVVLEDDSWETSHRSWDTTAEEDLVELLEALRKVYEFPQAIPALYLRVWGFTPRGVRRVGRGGSYLRYILTTVKLDVPVDRSTKRRVVLDGEHIIAHYPLLK